MKPCHTGVGGIVEVKICLLSFHVPLHGHFNILCVFLIAIIQERWLNTQKTNKHQCNSLKQPFPKFTISQQLLYVGSHRLETLEIDKKNKWNDLLLPSNKQFLKSPTDDRRLKQALTIPSKWSRFLFPLFVFVLSILLCIQHVSLRHIQAMGLQLLAKLQFFYEIPQDS